MERKRCRTWAVQEDNGGRVFPGGTNSTQLQLSHSSHDSLELSRQQEISFLASSLLSRSILPKLSDKYMKHCLDFFFTQNIISCIIRKKGNEEIKLFLIFFFFKEFKHFNLSCPFFFFFFSKQNDHKIFYSIIQNWGLYFFGPKYPLQGSFFLPQLLVWESGSGFL